MATDQTKPDAIAQALTHAALGSRYDQTFPVLTAAEIDRMRRFGTLHNYADGGKLFETGQPAPGMFVVLAGNVAIMQHDGMGHITPVVEQGAGRHQLPRQLSEKLDGDGAVQLSPAEHAGGQRRPPEPSRCPRARPAGSQSGPPG